MSDKMLPRIDAFTTEQPNPRAVVLVLHGGRSDSHGSGERKRLTYLRMVPFAKTLAHAGTSAPASSGDTSASSGRGDTTHSGHGGLEVGMLRYRYRGWNAPAKDALLDARWALDDIARRHPGVPVVLVGHSMGGRAALHAAGAPNVVAVCALAPWLDGSDPVDQLAGRTVLIAHGDQERWTDPRQSYAYAVRAKRVTDQVCRFDVLGDGHSMLRRAGDWHDLVRRFVLGVLGIEPLDQEIANALRQPSPSGLRAALSS